MKDFFKPKDFLDTKGCQSYPVETIASIANEKLNALIESWPTVYDGNSGNSFFQSETWGLNRYDEKDYSAISSNFTNSKRKARLAFIEEIVKDPKKPHTLADVLNDLLTPDQMTEAFKLGEQIASLVKIKIMSEKKPCKHEPTEWDVHWKNIICKHCGVELFAEWKTK